MRWRGSDGGRGRGTYGGGLMPGAASVPVSSGEGVAAIVVTQERAATIDDCLARLRAARGVSQVSGVDNGSRADHLEIVQRSAATERKSEGKGKTATVNVALEGRRNIKD